MVISLFFSFLGGFPVSAGFPVQPAIQSVPTEADVNAPLPVVWISRQFADLHFDGGGLGERISWDGSGEGDGRWAEIVITISMFAFLCVITFVSFVFGQRLVAFFGQGGLGVITRIMGLILAVISVQMVIDGVAGAIQVAQ